jgi:hypothetical protein
MLSWMTMERIMEREMAINGKYRKQVARRPRRSDAKGLSDEQLVAKLHSLGVEIDRPGLERLSEQALSAEELARPLLKRRAFRNRHEELEGDWIWIGLATLWQRWFPDQPCFELLDDQMQVGLRPAGLQRLCGGLPYLAGGVEGCAAPLRQKWPEVHPRIR